MVIKCKMCGGDLKLIEGVSTAECEFCGSVQTVPNLDDEKKLIQFERAERLRKQCEFDKAAGIYEKIVVDFRQEAEAYWGLVLCKYGIEYVDDPATGKKIPTCHRSSFDSIMEDDDFEQALENADPTAQRVYRNEAKAIEEIRKGIIAVSADEQPYDIFICYKETAENGDRTLDSVLAQEVYDALIGKGYRVFFSRISLEDKLGVEYEPYIFAALNSAKIMLAFGTAYEYYNAVWVKNEWSRFLKLMAKDKDKHLIPCYKGIDAYDMPKEFAKLQAQDLGKVGATQDLLRGIEKIIPRQAENVKETIVVQQVAVSNPTVESYLKRAFMFLEEKDWNGANEYCEKVLDIDPENAQAYLGKLLAECKASCVDALRNCENPVDSGSNYKNLMCFAEDTLKETVQQYLAEAKDILQKLRANGFDIRDHELHKYTGTQTEVQIPDSLTSIGKLAFYKCTSLSSITIPDSVTSIGDSAFSGCTSLTSITIPDSVTSIGEWAFWDCTLLTSITIPDGVTSIGKRAFDGCTSLTSITIPESVTSIGERAFDSCTLLTSITIPDSVTSIGDSAFSECKSLTSVTILDGVTSIGDWAFSDCAALTSITIPSSVTSIGEYAFDGCTSLSSITIPSSVTSIVEALRVCESLTSVTILDGVTSIGEGAFSDFTSLTSITIPDSVTSIGDSAFRGCTSLSSITIPDSVTSIGERTFRGCTSLSSIIIPDSVTRIGVGAFSDCTSLSSITIPDSVTSIGKRAFYDCTSLSSITIPDSVTSIGKSTFSHCTSLSSITIPSSVTSIGNSAFSDCTSLSSITIPSSVTSIGESAFSRCTSLTSVTILDGVTSIGGYAFSYCKSLSSVIIPGSVTSIGISAFQCESLAYAVILGNAGRTIDGFDSSVFSKSVTIYTVPNSSVAQWAKKNGNKVRAIPSQYIQQSPEDIARAVEEIHRRCVAGLCQHCGGELKGLFGKKCVACGKPKDY